MELKYNDRQHAYWLDGKRCKGVTTVAKIPDDTWGLEAWNKRMVAIGMAISPHLVQRGAAHFDERDPMDDIAEEALVAAKAHVASGRGTAIHRETERADLGLDWIDTPETRAIRHQWTTALAEAGLEVVPEYVERIVVYPDQLVAGRFDRLCRRTSDGRLVVVDVKTGENAIKYPHSTVCQLATYANAPLMCGPMRRVGHHEIADTFEPMPDDLDRSVGYVVYLPVEGPGQVYKLDLTAGWDTVTRICFPTITWRKQTGLIEQVTVPGLAESVDLPVAALDTRITWLRGRVATLKEQGHGDQVAANWPAGVPTIKQGGLTDVHVDQVATMLDRVEAEVGQPFGATDPLFEGFATADTPPAPHTPTPASGPEQARAELARHWTTKCREVLEQFDQVEADAIRDLVINQPQATTQRHFELIDAVIGQLVDPNGAVILTYSIDGPAITPTDADDRIRQTCRTKTAALARGKNLAKELGRPLPRTFEHVCADPALAALVAAGLGLADTTNNNPDTETHTP